MGHQLLQFICKNQSKIGFKSLFLGLVCLISSLQTTDRLHPEKENLSVKNTKFGLSIDGISMDGSHKQNYMSALWLEALEQQVWADHKVRLNRVFDYVSGTAFRGVLSLGVALEIPASDFVVIFEEKQCQSLFDKNSSDAEIDKILKSKFGENTLGDLEIPVFIAGYSSEGIPYAFENKDQDKKISLCHIAKAITINPNIVNIYVCHSSAIIANNYIFNNNHSDLVERKMRKRWPNDTINLLSLSTGTIYTSPWFGESQLY